MSTGIIESLDHEARGVTRLDGKTVFVEGALPGECVEYASYRRKPSYELARTLRVLTPSPARVTPRCPHFGVCGGCSMQHLDPDAQVAAKQRLLEDNLWHIGRVRPDQLYAPIYGQPWAYRHRARLSVRFVVKKGGVLVGFHEKKSSYVADLRQCEILPPHLSSLLLPLRELVGAMSIRDRLPQIEVAIGERVSALVLRILEAPSAADEILLRDFAERHAVVFYLQPQGPATAYRFHPAEGPQLSYLLPDFAVEHFFSPTEFTQVNHAINRVLVRRAVALLEPQPGDRIADMFCGLGNFTLPIARSGAHVLGVEGSPELLRRAAANAVANGLGALVEYRVANLLQSTPESLAELGHFDKMLIDPPREGAVELIKSLAVDGPRRIVYISCSPATLARDAAILVTQKDYRLCGAGVVNMFPQTSHVESIALFERRAAG
ncbi:MAG TPA: 23S rRNA (uracil(1939)-C(5))-methyltransferase RlmD [Accumulibacter sp.]|uniref:23S rRNA (uracil(1939)-C(5))-methyltransferase RlmD n=1 Tax=Accumulibacter sp. TaxID=2053492 RepID=UPI0025E504B8|nr:23S rRNA (uracil(1939)-C(5))-methyltransferase RlmD [Accumulibacter sp.]MCM8597836.1 23S rRNA (uracil(1939)-C(5))-methyltransferase RlmD [Accumulibacter sp.]MCM8661880.1 23S rRNA (uracil(1939)-C(5))-methyltransferase RlmD [Accumulibacter sp.]HNC51998.1 23S rRNA (uracil(1939)-C(5))-methyltransferase RlmD [Accumulibacter sp.]